MQHQDQGRISFLSLLQFRSAFLSVILHPKHLNLLQKHLLGFPPLPPQQVGGTCHWCPLWFPQHSVIPSNTKPKQDKPGKVSWIFPLQGNFCVGKVWGVGSAAELSVTPCIGNMPMPFPAVTQFLFLEPLLFFLRICFKPGEGFLCTYWISSLPHALPLFPTPLQTTQDPPHSSERFSFPPPLHAFGLFQLSPDESSQEPLQQLSLGSSRGRNVGSHHIPVPPRALGNSALLLECAGPRRFGSLEDNTGKALVIIEIMDL